MYSDDVFDRMAIAKDELAAPPSSRRKAPSTSAVTQQYAKHSTTPTSNMTRTSNRAASSVTTISDRTR